MEASRQIWFTIFGFIGLSICISIVTHFWIRLHLKNKAANPSPQSNATKSANSTSLNSTNSTSTNLNATNSNSTHNDDAQ